MRKLTRTILFLGILFTNFSVGAQLLEKANKHFDSFSYQEAVELYEIIWQKDSSNLNIAKQLANSYRLVNNTEKSEQWYARLIKTEIAESEDYLHYSRALQSNMKYSEAKLWMEKYLENSNTPNQDVIDLGGIAKLKENSLKVNVEPISANSEASDFGVAYYRNDVVFSSAREKTSLIKRNHLWNNQNYLRLYQAHVGDEGNLLNASLFSKNLTTNLHDGPVCFTNSGDEMFLTRNYLSSSKRAKRNNQGVVSIKLYHCNKEGDDWSAPELLSINLDGYSTGHPALAADGKSLYFISDRPGGFGGTDLYVSTKIESGWSEPKNLGDKINTPENEMFPFVDGTNKLFFASKGHLGFGGLDIFSIDLNDSNSKPLNLGSPINSAKDDFNLILKKGSGYFASNRLKGESYDDIYYFTLLSRTIKGQVFNAETKEILGNTKVSLIDKTGKLSEVITDSDGKFLFEITKIDNYQLRSEKKYFFDGEGAIPASELRRNAELNQLIYQIPDRELLLDGIVVYQEDQFPVDNVNVSIKNKMSAEIIDLTTDANGKFSVTLLRDIDYIIEYHKKGILGKSRKLSTHEVIGNKLFAKEEVDKVQVGKVFVLDNIFYDVNKSNIRIDAAFELDKLVVVMTDNPSLKIELSSHTDSRGSDSYNMALSKRRAIEAVEYIVSKGISPDRLKAKGYGETKLINRCANGVTCSKEEHQANRRTEVKILEM
ncbi:hypothetical protein BZG02_13560 [Labilibaculum filiforme]|uniref:OmpA-like domain-containing protein n=1 Tax=Labilibaculum filiforme TaxID=1940526 RepID=A0A2N3HW83_9BACT|nr:OmpA family protein [Labilibaculum filiforme]PKQ62330.1 hypothetical protein BZG02_13560 [Labilibaculum filiforme]